MFPFCASGNSHDHQSTKRGIAVHAFIAITNSQEGCRGNVDIMIAEVERIRSGMQQINRRVLEVAKEHELASDELEPIYDGVFDVEGYLASNPRLMWVLKEPFDDFDENGMPSGGGWSLTDDCIGKKDEIAKSWYKMIYTTYCLRHNIEFVDMPSNLTNQALVDVLKDVAYINVSKMPGQSQSSESLLNSAYEIWKPILFDQIELLDPQVIIFGGTYGHFKHDFELRGARKVSNEQEVYLCENRLHISAYHPAIRTVSNADYVSGIRQAFQVF